MLANTDEEILGAATTQARYSAGWRSEDDRVTRGLPGLREGGCGHLLVGMIGAGIIEVNDVLIGIDPGDHQEVIGRGALVAGVPDDCGIDVGDHLASAAEILLHRGYPGLIG